MTPKRMDQPPQTSKFHQGILIALQLVIVILAIALGYFGHRFLHPGTGEFNLLREAHELVLDNTLYEVPDEPALEYGMIRGMLDALGDPYASLVEPALHEIRTDQLTGRFGGLGVRLERDADHNWLLFPQPDSPAEDAGIEDGDQLVQVDNQSITPEMDETTLIALIRGPEGESVTLSIQRNRQTLTFTIEREVISLPSVSWQRLPETPEIGMIRVNLIAATTPEEIEDALDELLESGINGLILDLRDNTGGLVEPGVQISRLFLEEGEIVRRQFRDQDAEIFTVDEPGRFSQIPMVVLINENTASAAEIVTGAIKANQRGFLVGRPTFGKTTIQFIFELQDGSSINITSGRWFVPDLDFPLQPDQSIEQDQPDQAFIQEAVNQLQDVISP